MSIDERGTSHRGPGEVELARSQGEIVHADQAIADANCRPIGDPVRGVGLNLSQHRNLGRGGAIITIDLRVSEIAQQGVVAGGVAKHADFPEDPQIESAYLAVVTGPPLPTEQVV